MRGSSFTVKSGSVERVTGKLLSVLGTVDKEMMKRMTLATTIVYKVATSRRPKITPQQHKALGGKKGGYRVSDPNAAVGVPVKTGALQISIKKTVEKKGEKYIGTIFTTNPYAKFMEFGTSKIKPRSFLRSAMNEQGQAIKNIFNKPIE